jgi:hypothetical protein
VKQEHRSTTRTLQNIALSTQNNKHIAEHQLTSKLESMVVGIIAATSNSHHAHACKN